MFYVVFDINAQKVTFNHDPAKMNQITVQEIGSGALTPDIYYSLLHRRYKMTAANKNKMNLRMTVAISAYRQIDDAEYVDSAFVKRAEIEALNMADRKTDLVWASEGAKIQSKLADFERNIIRIQEMGESKHQIVWKEYANKFRTAIQAIHNSYMPNSQRKKEYMQIFADISNANDNLMRYIVQLNMQNETASMLNAKYNKPDNKSQIATAARVRWRNSSYLAIGRHIHAGEGFDFIDGKRDPIRDNTHSYDDLITLK